jgi:RNA polymerase sigma-70 factor (ECF subfamily)
MDAMNADQFLIEQVRCGDQTAWRQIIERYEGRLAAYARLRIRSIADAEDIVQETFVGLLRSLENFDNRRSLETYLFSILRKKIVDRLRERKRVALQAPDDDGEWWDRVLPLDSETPSDILVDRETRADFETRLSALLRRLIHDMRDRSAFDDLAIIELVFYKGMRNLDVAGLFDIDQKAVAGVKFRAIQKLQKFLTESDQPFSALTDTEADVTVARVWREHRLTCLKRSTLGSHLLGVLEEPWNRYTQFHLDVVSCPMCLANLADLEVIDEGENQRLSESIFASSIGFLSRASDAGSS